MVEQLGNERWQRIVSQAAPSQNADYIASAAEITGRLLASAGQDPALWELRVFAGSEVNAIALPKGKIGIYEGMFSVAELSDQLAAVIGHEMGHTTARHSEERIAAAMAQERGLRLVSTALQLGDVAYPNEIAALLGIGVEFGLVLPYTRGQELEADRIELLLMDQAGYDPRQAIALGERMATAGRERGPAFLSTHPRSGTPHRSHRGNSWGRCRHLALQLALSHETHTRTASRSAISLGCFGRDLPSALNKRNATGNEMAPKIEGPCHI